MKAMKRPTRVRGEKGESTLKRILRYVGKYPVSLIGSLVFAAVSVAAELGCAVSAFEIIPNLIYPYMLLLSSLIFVFIIPEKKTNQ